MGLFDIFKRKEKKKTEKKSIKPQFDIQKALELNYEFISQEEIKVEDIEKQFVQTDTRCYVKVGEVDCPTGNIVVSDPLCYLQGGDFCPVLTQTVPKGTYPVEVAICKNDYIGVRMCTARLKIKDSCAKRYVCADNLRNVAGTIKSTDNGFPVDAGMMSFCDEQVAKEYLAFLDKWHKKNKKKNIYDHYFAKRFKESHHKKPQYQREEGDFIEWKNPKSKHKMVMVASGLGDGFYQSYWGYDEMGEVCELIVPMVNPALFEK